MSVSLLAPCYDIDGIDDLRRVMNEGTAGQRTRAWIASYAEIDRLMDVHR